MGRRKVGEEKEKWGQRKIMASAARREVGGEGEIELLTWGMQYAPREGKKKERELTLLLTR